MPDDDTLPTCPWCGTAPKEFRGQTIKSYWCANARCTEQPDVTCRSTLERARAMWRAVCEDARRRRAT